MRVGDALSMLIQALRPEAQECAAFEAECILQELLNLSRSQLYLESRRTLSMDILDSIQNIINKRLSGMPLAYVLGSTHFFGLELQVSPAVLIPRPDTEILVDLVLLNFDTSPLRLLDLCTGSGAIAAALGVNRPQWEITATDLSPSALQIARTNLASTRAHLVCADMLSAFVPRNQFDCITCNPPYIARHVLTELDHSVKNFEPLSALDGGEDGLRFYRLLDEQAGNWLTTRGRIYAEIGFDQQGAVESIFSNNRWCDVSIKRDLANRPRVLVATKRV
jgi:release factor glutamine methyltransferase